MYVSATSSRFSRGRSTPTRRAIVGSAPSHLRRSCAPPASLPGRAPASDRGCSAAGLAGSGLRCVKLIELCPGSASALTLLVPRVRADDHDPAVPADDPALAADLLHTRLDLHCLVSSWVPPHCGRPHHARSYLYR